MSRTPGKDPRSPVASGPLRTMAAAAVVTLAMTPKAFADDDGGGIRLSPVQIFGTPAAVQEHPGAVTVVDEREVEQRAATRAMDLLESSPGVNLQSEDFLGRRGNIGIRGLNPRRSRKVHLMEDGAPFQLGPYGDPTTHYQPSPRLVREVEVIKGSGSILYGPQTIGGAVNFLTVDPPEEPRWLVRGAAGSEGYGEGHLSWGGTSGNSGTRLDYVHQETDGAQDDQTQRVKDLFFKNRTELDNDHAVTFKFTATDEVMRGKSEAGLTQELYKDDPRQNPLPRDRFEMERYAAQFTHQWRIQQGMELSTNLYGNIIERTSFRQAGDATGLDNCPDSVDDDDITNADECGGRIRPRDYRTYGVEPRLSLDHDLFGDFNRAVVGARVQREVGKRETFHTQNKNPKNAVLECDKFDGDDDCARRDWLARSATAYAQNTTYFGDWSVTPGARVEYWKFEETQRERDGDFEGVTDEIENSYTEVLPGLGATWEGLRNATVYAGVHRGLSPAPLSGIDEGAAPDPEFSWNYELGVRTRDLRGITADVNYFLVDYRDIIVADVDPTERAQANAGRARLQGIELAGRLDSQPLFDTEQNYYLTGNVTWLDTEFRETVTVDDLEGLDDERDEVRKGNEFPAAPEWTLYAAAGMETGPFDGRIGVRYVDEQFTDNGNTKDPEDQGTRGIVPSYTVWEASARYRINPDLKLFVVGRNITDKTYFNTREGGVQTAMPRQVFAGVEATF